MVIKILSLALFLVVPILILTLVFNETACKNCPDKDECKFYLLKYVSSNSKKEETSKKSTSAKSKKNAKEPEKKVNFFKNVGNNILKWLSE